MIIRAMREADAIAVHRVHSACLTTSLAADYSPEQIAAWMHGRSPEGYWHFATTSETFRVAERDAAVVAFANWRGEELRSLFVDPAHQRGGIGTALLAACLAETRLSCVKATPGATGFYARFGFVEMGPGHDLKRGIALPHVLMRRPAAD